MVIGRNEIKNLAKSTQPESPVVSLYLNVVPTADYKTTANSLIHNSRNKLKDSDKFSEEQRTQLENLFPTIEDYIRLTFEREENARLLALFASTDEMWREYQLPVSLPSNIVVDPDPYTRPLMALLDQFDRYGVVVSDARKAKIFTLYLGEMEEHKSVFITDEVPDNVRTNLSITAGPGGRGGLGDKRIERHIKDHYHRHLKNVAAKTFDFFKKEGPQKLILGTPDDDKTLPWLEEQLHSYLKERVIGEFNARPDDHQKELKEKALDVALLREKQQEQELLDNLIETHNSGGKTTLGIERTLEALMLGQIRTLVVENDFKYPGFICPDDHYLSTYLENCPICEQNMWQVEDLADEMVEEAISQNSEIKHIFISHDEFQKYQSGSFLRFTL